MVRNQILDHLALNKGDYVSGEELSQGLNMTRAAIWKHMKSLKEDGYVIEAAPKKGYCLRDVPFSLDEWALHHEFRTRNLSLNLHFFEELTSTNDQAKQLARRNLAETAVVVAKTQHSGKGRHGRKWESPEGGVWMSALLHPKLSLADVSKATLVAGIAVVNALKELYGIEAGIKWPNDVVYKGRKLAGILGEVTGEWTSVQNLILGVGINGNFSAQTLPGNIGGVTLHEILQREVNLNQLAASVLDHIFKELGILEKDGFHLIKESWLKRSVGLGKQVQVRVGQDDYYGIFEGINEEGALMLRNEETLRSFTAGDVHLRSAKGEYNLEE